MEDLKPFIVELRVNPWEEFKQLKKFKTLEKATQSLNRLLDKTNGSYTY